MPILDRILQGLLGPQGLQVADVRLDSILDAAQGQVQVRASQGGEPGPCVVGNDGRQELVARSEPDATQANMNQ